MATTAERAREGDERPLRAGEWRTLAVLGLPTFALALAITTVTTYLPVVASGFAASTVVIGLLIGGEGLMALGLPVAVGAWSDRLHTRIGGGLAVVLGAQPVLLAAPGLLGLVTGNPPPAGAGAGVFVRSYVAGAP